MHFELIKKYSKQAKIILVILLFFVLVDILFPLPEQKEFSKEILSSDGTLMTAYLTSGDKWRLETNLEEINPVLVKAIINKEDKWFYWHFGVNPVSVFRSLFTNITGGEIKSGASTISMQVIRLLEKRDRTYLNKIIEMIRAIQLEINYSKKEILEIYLSLLTFGGNIEGVKSASYIYFNKPPNKLSLAQSILLAVIPNDPNNLRLDRENESVLQIRNKLIKRFQDEKLFSDQQLDDALNEPFIFSRNELPDLAPHLCSIVKDRYAETKIQTTINLSLQQKAEQLLLNHVIRNRLRGISNGAVLILDNKNNSVVAYCGSADFYDNNSSGQVNGITAIRSPGSTLKPFLYAINIDQGTLTPKMRLLDIPTDFSGYQPENYELKFNGEVESDFALVTSLNIPAVRLLEKSGLDEFITFLSSAGMNQIQQQKNKLGLSMILGGCGVTLEELTRFFSAFARGGILSQVRYIIDEQLTENKKIFSEETSYLISNILSGIERKDIVDLSYYSKLPKFAWKTGTSYGKRDAWAIGFNPNYTIGVWMGNFDGKGSPYLSGTEAAVPLLFDLFNSIDYHPQSNWFQQPENLVSRKVCIESGLLPSANCIKLTYDYSIQNVSHNIICNLHQPVYVSLDETVQYCSDCLPEQNFKRVIYPMYEGDLTIWMMQNNFTFSKPPDHNDKCQAKYAGKGPEILSPMEDYEYLIEKNSGQELMLLAASDSRVKAHYWFIDDKYFSKTKPGEKLFYAPEKNNLKITCLDDKGRDSRVSISVKYF
jgi:penicillin-binding protein 1C